MSLFSKKHYQRNIIDYENNLKAFSEGKAIPRAGEIVANQITLAKEKQRLEELLKEEQAKQS